MAANINGHDIPLTMANRGRYLFASPEILGRNGQGQVVQGDYSSITWTFPLMTYSDYSWWRNTLLEGEPSKVITSSQLWDDLGNLINFHGVVLQPTYEFVSNNYFNNVVIKFEDLV